MRIYVDFDDVLCETARALAAVAREVFARNVPYEEIAVFDLRHAFSLSNDEIEHLMDLAHEAEFLEDLDPTPGAVEAIRFLQAAGHDVVIVTGRPSSCHEGSVRWMKRFGLDHIEIIYADKYGRVPKTKPQDGPETLSLDAFRALSFDIAIDDSPMAIDLLKEMENCEIIIYDRPWNREYDPDKELRRCPSWSEIMELF